MHEHRGDYGIDGSFDRISARGQVAAIGALAAGLAACAAMGWARGSRATPVLAGASAAGLVASTAWYGYATRTGKFVVWDEILDALALDGGETVLDLGCGRGAVLVAAAKRVPWGRAIGVDLWHADQTENSQQATLSNAAAEGVTDRVEVHTADMTALPFPDGSVDVIVSNLAIHNIAGHAGRRKALEEAIRVLRPGGRLAIADLWETDRHAARLRELGWPDVRHRGLGWRMCYGGPWFSTRLVTATKPSVP